MDVLHHSAANTTTINLEPLDEATVVDFVSTSLARPREHVLPLAIVCLEKSNGNPFYLRQMLEICHRRGAIWYSWQDASWEYDLDRVFAEFASPEYGQQLDANFITKRLQDLPAASRFILAWASLIGTSFSFELIQSILGSENKSSRSRNQSTDCPLAAENAQLLPAASLIEGLEAALQAYILVPGNIEDEYCFSHDRYLRAATYLRECTNVSRMHFVIAKVMMENAGLDSGFLYAKAQHVSEAVNLIRTQIDIRKPYRDVLSDSAREAIQGGARPTALRYYEQCLALLQSRPWDENGLDVDYKETLEIHTQAAELYWHLGELARSQDILDTIFANAREGISKVQAYILQSRVLMQEGSINGALSALKTPLRDLGLKFAFEPTWDICDNEYTILKKRLHQTSFEDLVRHPVSSDPEIKAMGAVLLEAISGAFWSDSLLVC